MDDAMRDVLTSFEQPLDDLLAVDRKEQRLSDTLFGERRMIKAEVDVFVD